MLFILKTREKNSSVNLRFDVHDCYGFLGLKTFRDFRETGSRPLVTGVGLGGGLEIQDFHFVSFKPHLHVLKNMHGTPRHGARNFLARHS